MVNGLPTKMGGAEHVDCVIVGSGFGGSVAAFRFAEARRSVIVLERGWAYPPGSFARSPAAMSRNFWDPSEGLYGLFDVWSFRGLEAVVSSGLGGGSLIYANVLLRKDERWFVHESPVPGGGYENWPVTRVELDQHYDRVETMLGATPYPYPETPKTAVMQESAARLGLKLPVTATGGHLHLAHRRAGNTRSTDPPCGVWQRTWPTTADLPTVW